MSWLFNTKRPVRVVHSPAFYKTAKTLTQACPEVGNGELDRTIFAQSVNGATPNDTSDPDSGYLEVAVRKPSVGPKKANNTSETKSAAPGPDADGFSPQPLSASFTTPRPASLKEQRSNGALNAQDGPQSPKGTPKSGRSRNNSSVGMEPDPTQQPPARAVSPAKMKKSSVASLSKAAADQRPASPAANSEVLAPATPDAVAAEPEPIGTQQTPASGNNGKKKKKKKR